MDRFNGHMLVLGRDARGLTQSDLAEALSVTQGTQSKYETGLLQPSEDYVVTASAALSFPPSFFYQPGRPYGFPPFHYRKRKKLTAKALARIVAEMNLRRMHIQKMLVSYALNSNNFIPEIDPDEYTAGKKGALNVEDVARGLRELWMLPSGPIPNMVELLETSGGIVIPCDFGTDLLDAMSQRVDGLPVLFFINMHAPADRVRHTLAHELCHMALHTLTLKDDEVMEDEADNFAGAFLLPADEVRPQLREFTLKQLARMKAHWKVSMASIAVRADRLNLITPYQKRKIWIEMSQHGYRKREPIEPPAESPKTLKKMVAFHRRKLGYSVQDMAALLNLHVPEFESMYGADDWQKPEGVPHLRLVQ